MPGKKSGWLLGGLIFSSITAVAIYNLWAYCCGRCRVDNFLTIGPYGQLLFGLNVAAAVGWMVMRRVRVRSERTRLCCCGVEKRTGWRFCPWCGQSTTLDEPGTPGTPSRISKAQT